MLAPDPRDSCTDRLLERVGGEVATAPADQELEYELTVAAAMAGERHVVLQTDHHIAEALESLLEEFREHHDHGTVARVMEDSLSRLADSPLEDAVPALAHRLARERLKALARAAGRIPRDRPEILFVGLGGRGRSQMAAALASLRSGGRVFAHPVGTNPGIELDTNVVQAMGELGVDLANAYPVPLTEEVLAAADVIVTLGRSVGAVEIPAGVRRKDWRVGDPVGAPLPEVRRIREDLDRRIQELLAELLDQPEERETRYDHSPMN